MRASGAFSGGKLWKLLNLNHHFVCLAVVYKWHLRFPALPILPFFFLDVRPLTADTFFQRAFAARNTERGGGALSDLYFRGKVFLLLRYYISLFAVVYTSLPPWKSIELAAYLVSTGVSLILINIYNISWLLSRPCLTTLWLLVI